jgi:hypothetical protein
MPVRLTVRIKKTNPPEIRLRELNAIIREGLTVVAGWWITECLPKHFLPSGVQRYGYSARKPSYLAVKRRMQKVRLWEAGYKKGAWVPAPKPPGPLVWTGELRRTLLEKSPEDFNIKAIATSKKQTVRVPCPIPHPMSKEQTGELTRIINEEFRMMHEIAFEYIAAKLDAIKEQTVTAIAA